MGEGDRKRLGGMRESQTLEGKFYATWVKEGYGKRSNTGGAPGRDLGGGGKDGTKK